MGGLVRADGWEAVYEGELDGGKRYTFSKPVVVWHDAGDGQVIGLVAGEQKGSGGLRSAEAAGNFLYYRESERHGTPVAAGPGWWIVKRAAGASGQAYWTRAVAWIVGPDGDVTAVASVGSDSTGYPDGPTTLSETDRFLYEPSRAAEGEGPWPWAETETKEEEPGAAG